MPSGIPIWSEQEDKKLHKLALKYKKNWIKIANEFNGRSNTQ